MIFFRKKKLIEIDEKTDSVLEHLSKCIQMHDNLLLAINRIENRLVLIEEKISDSQSAASQCIQESKLLVLTEISYLKECVRTLDSEIQGLSEINSSEFITRTQSIVNEIICLKNEFLKCQEKGVVTLGESLSTSSDLLKKLITDDGIVSRNKIEELTSELHSKFELMDSSMRLLLLNSVMDQIEE